MFAAIRRALWPIKTEVCPQKTSDVSRLTVVIAIMFLTGLALGTLIGAALGFFLSKLLQAGDPGID
jgi:hypothetical protein